MATTIERDWEGTLPAVGSHVVREGHGGNWKLLAGEPPENPAGVFFGVVTSTSENGVEIELGEAPKESEKDIPHDEVH
jgi:hypothetical protein